MKIARLSFLMFFEYAVWGGYLTTLGVYMLNAAHFIPPETVFVYASFGIAAIFAMPSAGLIADKLISAACLYAALLFLCGICLFPPAAASDKRLFFIIGFITAIWLVAFLGLSGARKQFYIAGGAAFVTAALSFAQKKVPLLSAGARAADSAEKPLFHIIRSKPLLWIYALFVCIGASVQTNNIYANKFFTGGAAIFADKYAPLAARSTAQSLLLMLYNGAGGMPGSFLTSYLIACYGGGKQIPWRAVRNFYGFYAAAAFLAAVCCLFFMLKKREI